MTNTVVYLPKPYDRIFEDLPEVEKKRIRKIMQESGVKEIKKITPKTKD